MHRPGSLPAEARAAASSLQEADEPLTLSCAFPDAQHDLDELFPEPHLQQLLLEIADDLRRVERFVGRLNRELKTEASVDESGDA